MFKAQMTKWLRRKERLGDAAVGRIRESYVAQGEKITAHLKPLLGDSFYYHGLDFGSGWGRLSGLLAGHCSHLWAADLFEDWLLRARSAAPNISTILIDGPNIQLPDSSMDLIVDIMTLQSIDEDELVRAFAVELRRLVRSQARIISLHVNKGQPSRAPDKLAGYLGLSTWTAHEVDDLDQVKERYSLLSGRM